MKKAKVLSVFGLSRLFPDEDSVIRFLESVLWGEKPICPRCQCTRTSPRPHRKAHRCNGCREEFSIRTGTIFAQTRLPLLKWIFAAYMLQTARKGISSLQLSKEIEVTQKTAWFLLHRLRTSCAPEVGLLMSGVVEADEVFIGGLESNKHANKKDGLRGHRGKAIVLGARERDSGRVVAFPVPDTSGNTLLPALREHISVESTLVTDDWTGYNSAEAHFYHHRSVCHSAKEYVNGMAHTNGIESVWAVLKRGFNGTYHSWSVKHLARYVNEFTFRLNEGNVRHDTIDRLKALILGSAGKRLTYADLTA